MNLPASVPPQSVLLPPVAAGLGQSDATSDRPIHATSWFLPAALAGSLVGAALQLQQALLWSVLAYMALAVAALLLGLSAYVLCRQKTFFRSTNKPEPISGWSVMGSHVWVFLFVSMLAFAMVGLRAAHYQKTTLPSSAEGVDWVVAGVVAAMPQWQTTGLRLRLEVESAHRAHTDPAAALQQNFLPPRIDVSWYSQAWSQGLAAGQNDEQLNLSMVRKQLLQTVHAGDRWQMTVRLKAPHGLVNPHGFDYELWMWEQGVQASGYVRDGPRDVAPKKLASTWRHPVEQARQNVRDAMQKRLVNKASAGFLSNVSTEKQLRVAGVLMALVTGDQQAIERQDWDVFRATGVAHLVSISGLHITMFAWVAAWLVGWLWRRSVRLCLYWPAPLAALWGGVLLAALYALFSGWGVPAQRTICMLFTIALLKTLGLRWPWPHVALLTAGVVVLWDPWALMQAGFWLSFVAVFVLFATNPAAVRAGGASDKGDKGDKSRWMALLREQWVVSLALAPLTLLLFGQVSLVGLLANLIAIPWITWVITPLALLGALFAPLWDGAAWALAPLLACLEWLAAWPLATLRVPAAPLWAGVFGLLGACLLVLRLPWPLRAMGLLLCVPVLFWQAPRPAWGQFELLAADVGQGNAVLVRTAGHNLLYDSGPRWGVDSDAGQRVLAPLLQALGVKLDMLVLSHRDSDHTGGAATLLALPEQAGTQVIGSIESGHVLQKIRPVQPCIAGQQWSWDGVLFEVLHPLAKEALVLAGPQPAALTDQEATDRTAHRGSKPLPPNAFSCVLRIRSADTETAENGLMQHPATALLVGDIEKAQELALIEREPSLKADWLLAPHHGSKTSSSPAFVAAVSPRHVLVQAGYRNRFGHPALEVAQRWRDSGALLFDSPHCGAATWVSSQPVQMDCLRSSQLRYWRHVMPD